MPKKLFSALVFIFLAGLFPAKFTHAVDVTAPVTTYIQAPSSPDGDSGWYVTPLNFAIESTDLESGVKEINYRIDSGTWQKVEFTDTLNLAPNPSFEIPGATSSGLNSWTATVVDADGVYSQDTTQAMSGFGTSSAKIEATAGAWHGINNKDNFAVTFPYENMTTSAWIKIPSGTGSASIKIYAIGSDATEDLIAETTAISGVTDWTLLSMDFIVTKANAIGVYMDIGISGDGVLNADAATLNSSSKTAQTSVDVASDSEDHRLEFYAVDTAGNIETYSCTSPAKNCIDFKLDTTPPGNWHDSGAFRGFFGSSHDLWVYTNVIDDTSGLSVFTDKYMYKTELNPTFGRYDSLSSCNNDWNPDVWTILITPPFSPGAKDAFLLTPRTDFCNDDWKICKTVRFYMEDEAGNYSTKEFCINGPWIKFSGEGVVKSNYNIDMLAESNSDNTDGLIEAGGTAIDFFSSSRNWKVTNATAPRDYDYSEFWDLVDAKTDITTTGNLTSNSGAYVIDSDFEITSGAIPGDYGTADFNQIVFMNGDLTISSNITTSSTSAALYIVSGEVKVAKAVTEVGIAIFADGDFSTAHDIEEGDDSETLALNGVYSANKFVFQRTLQGAGNEDTPSEDFTYEPKYLLKLKEFFDTSSVTWVKTE